MPLSLPRPIHEVENEACPILEQLNAEYARRTPYMCVSACAHMEPMVDDGKGPPRPAPPITPHQTAKLVNAMITGSLRNRCANRVGVADFVSCVLTMANMAVAIVVVGGYCP